MKQKYLTAIAAAIILLAVLCSCGGEKSAVSVSKEAGTNIVRIALPDMAYADVGVVVVKGDITDNASSWQSRTDDIREMRQLRLDESGNAQLTLGKFTERCTVIVTGSSGVNAALIEADGKEGA